jgi:hypothetical protein
MYWGVCCCIERLQNSTGRYRMYWGVCCCVGRGYSTVQNVLRRLLLCREATAGSLTDRTDWNPCLRIKKMSATIFRGFFVCFFPSISENWNILCLLLSCLLIAKCYHLPVSYLFQGQEQLLAVMPGSLVVSVPLTYTKDKNSYLYQALEVMPVSLVCLYMAKCYHLPIPRTRTATSSDASVSCLSLLIAKWYHLPIPSTRTATRSDASVSYLSLLIAKYYR